MSFWFGLVLTPADPSLSQNYPNPKAFGPAPVSRAHLDTAAEGGSCSRGALSPRPFHADRAAWLHPLPIAAVAPRLLPRLTGYGFIAFVRTLNYANGVVRNQNVQLPSTGTPGDNSWIVTRTNLIAPFGRRLGQIPSANGFFTLLLLPLVIPIIQLVLAHGDAMNESQHPTTGSAPF